MRKYLLIFMGVLSLFFFTDNVNALSFTATNGQEYTVDSEEKLLDYCYFTYIKDTNYANYNFLLGKTSTGDYKFIIYTSSSSVTHYNNAQILVYPSSSKVSYPYYQFTSSYSFSSNSTASNTAVKTIIYSVNDIYSGWSPPFDTTSFVANTSVADIESRYGAIPKYTITYYVNNEVYQTVEVEEGSSHELIEYTPDKNYQFSGWSYDETLDLSNVNSDINIYGTTTYSRPDMNYSEDINSIIHELSVSIIGKNVPVEFDYVYTIMDFIILIMLVLCVLAPFVLVIKLLSGRW